MTSNRAHITAAQHRHNKPHFKCYVITDMVPNITQLFLDHKDEEKELLVQYDTFMAKNSESD